MFPSLHVSAPALCERPLPRLPGREVERPYPSVALRAPLRSPPSSSAPGVSGVGGDVRSALTSVGLSAVGSTPLPTLHGLPFCPPSLSSAPSGPLSLPTPLLQYPTLYHPAHTPDFKQFSLTQYQAVNQAALASEMSKLKAPFINRNYLELAMLVCNTFRGKLFPCPHCRYVTDRRNNLKRHVATMHQACDKVLECCGVHFNTKASLREHIMIFHHNGYSCPYCGRRFCRKALLKRHLSVHSGQKDYTCPHCDYATSHKSNLERHKRIHERIRMIDEDGNVIERPADGGSPSHLLPDTTMGAGSDVGHIDVEEDEDLCEIVDDVDDDLSSSDGEDIEEMCRRERERRMHGFRLERPPLDLGEDNSGPMDCSMKTSLLRSRTATTASAVRCEAVGKPEDLSMCKKKPETVSVSEHDHTVSSARDSATGSDSKNSP